MPHNLFISYDLIAPGQKYDRVAAKIKTLGNWAKVQKSFWYLSTNLSAKDAASAIWSVLDSNDSLIVVDASANDAYWYNLTPESAQFIQRHWESKNYA
ncbi:hypothetical protein D3880_15760 [Pseudomonas cavernae]|uniref:Uncharacterized protein n=1 Tax=Pseudomonas cavernae TaxID=2320867 RepID=A0A385Z380_9PSED|nr:hypothetical protein [Pseudomonas cavernae]AYC33719.1 hypothetical protein D3880_15760 [Pseudomonas cavernae]